MIMITNQFFSKNKFFIGRTVTEFDFPNGVTPLIEGVLTLRRPLRRNFPFTREGSNTLKRTIVRLLMGSTRHSTTSRRHKVNAMPLDPPLPPLGRPLITPRFYRVNNNRPRSPRDTPGLGRQVANVRGLRNILRQVTTSPSRKNGSLGVSPKGSRRHKSGLVGATI